MNKSDEVAAIHAAAADQLDFRFLKIQKEIEKQLGDIRSEYKKLSKVKVEVEVEETKK